jgi:MFS family permease
MVRPRQILQPDSRQHVSKLAALFAVDSFAGGFVLQSIVAFWFFSTFDVPLSTISLVFLGANVLTAISFLAAARLARKIGLVNTMVFTHIPSNIFLILVPLAPSFLLALAFYLARMSLSQMDVPTRQSYTVAIVRPEERTAAAGITNLSRNVSQAISPSIAGSVLQFLTSSLPFFVGGGMKIVYDLLLYVNFRVIKPPEEIPPPKS